VLGYRFDLVATLRLELARPDGDPARYEARSSLTRIYHYASNGMARAGWSTRKPIAPTPRP
jgi:hypothetical protein